MSLGTSHPGKEDKVSVDHIEDSNFHDTTKIERDGLVSEAIKAEHAEHEEGVFEACRNHYKAVFWSLLMSMCIVMEAYDGFLIGNLFAQESFRDHFGVYVESEGKKFVPAAWQTGLQMAPIVGAFVGVVSTGWIADHFGYKRTAIGAQIMMIAVIFSTFFAPNLTVLVVGEFLCGLPWGAFVVVSPAYASEIAPLALRGIMTQYIQMCWCIGQFVAAGVLYALRNRTDHWAFKIPFAIQWAWPVPIIALLCFAPESPYWLVRKGRLEEAQRVVQRLSTHHTKASPHDTVMAMQRVHEIEQRETRGGSYLDCFRGTDLRRTLIMSITHAGANLTGLLLSNLSTYFFTLTGMDSNEAFALGLGTTAIQFVAVIGSWAVTTYCGRRPPFLWGAACNGIVCLIIGILACLKQTPMVMKAQGGLVIILAFQYGFTLGPIIWAYQGDISSLRLRSQSVAIARDSYYATAVVFTILNNYMLSPTGWNLVGKSAFIWMATCFAMVAIGYYHLPEVKGRNYRELDILFHRRTDARKFSTEVIDDAAEE